ncbi:DUF5131 family protein [uncultured Helicobacter sp.]|uniref:DUF5131 family protein n=1 Tax=uncultured Helicobacter sp. TaxID=175537 RepID=UPI002632DA00|nr:DUF5131 family protein [uncultured Helicobacter sp.]
MPKLPYLDSSKIAEISVGGESRLNARVCDFAWVVSLQEQAKLAGIRFHFHQTGANFLKDSKFYRIPKKQILIGLCQVKLKIYFKY